MVTTGGTSQSSGTTVESSCYPPESQRSMDDPSSPSPKFENTAGEEQALESHEVIELQSFSERKAWIEEKIKFLEKMPPIEVFAGLDAVRTSSEHVPELPTPEELSQWVTEHDAIEKETEIFDRGELTKLRQLTKAATQRNLSPADTDVIELTLTTIYALDKLLHLLRDRSENLELLGIRLSWEESRIAAWVERRKLLDDLRTFLEHRARWSPSAYSKLPQGDEHHDMQRRSSVTSLASVNSDTIGTLAGFSRSVRFKLAELLSRDAAQFAARVTALRHGRISAAGKILDKIIENSRKPVPEELLDEQDRLEEKGITDMEHLGKFVMNMVMQWRKADEIYVETMKDETMAQNLLEEIEIAKLHHPTPRQSASLTSRADTLIKRLALRGNPALPTSTFPCPEHTLFDDQKDSNKALIQLLSTEIANATDAAQKADAAAKGYQLILEAVKRVDGLTASARELSATFTSLITRIREGVSAEEGDGSPPNLTSNLCLDPSRHSVFLALLPSLLQETAHTSDLATQVLSRSLPATLNLNHPGISAEFRTAAMADFRLLESLHNQAREACDDVQAKSARLREARRIQASVENILVQLEDVRQRIADAMEMVRLRQNPGSSEDPPVHESLSAEPTPDTTLRAQFETEILQLGSQMTREIDVPLASLDKNLEDTLKQCLLQRSSEPQKYKDGLMKMVEVLDLIQRQASIMRIVRTEFNDIQLRIDHAKSGIEMHIDQVLTGRLVNGNIPESGISLQAVLEVMENEVTKFTDGLPDRILFVTQPIAPFSVTSVPGKKRFPSMDYKFGQHVTSLELPFDLDVLNGTIRGDANSFVITLKGRIEALTQKLAHFHLASMANEFDTALATTNLKLTSVHQDLVTHKSALSDISLRGDDTAEVLRTLSQGMEKALQNERMELDLCFASIQELIQKMNAVAGTQDLSVRDALYSSRRRAMEDAQARYQSWDAELSAFIAALSMEQKAVLERLERLENFRIEEERRLQEQRERLAMEESERRRVEQERLEREEQDRLEEIQRAESLKLQTNKQRLAFEEAEKARLEHERVEAEEKQRLEEIRLADEKRTQDLKDRVAEEEAEKARLQHERQVVEEKLRLAEQELAEERRFQLEKDRIISEKLKQDTARRLSDPEQLQPQTPDAHPHGEHQRQAEAHVAADRLPHPVEGGKIKTNRLKRRSMDGSQYDAKGGPSADEKRGQSNDTTGQERINPAGTDKPRLSHEEDVFTLSTAPIEGTPKTQEMKHIQAQVLAFRKQLRSMNINEVARPKNASANLPNFGQVKKMTREFSSIKSGASLLPLSVSDSSADVELKSLKAEIETSAELMQRVEKLAQMMEEIQKCDLALSDLLEHIDCYPASPGNFVSIQQHNSPNASAEGQLTTHLTFTRSTIESMTLKFGSVSGDSRAVAEKARIVQTWSELEEMALERLGGRKSRPSSAISSRPGSGRNSSASTTNIHSSKKFAGYSNLSASSHKRLLVPNHPTPRRAVSGGSAEDHSRPPSQVSSLSSNRAVSGPFAASIYGSTFASRQRTTSLSNSHSTPTQHTFSTPARTRAQTSQHPHTSSPPGPEISSHSRSTRDRTRSSSSMSSWSRAPRNSLSSTAPTFSSSKIKKRPTVPRKTYVPDPKNKLDVAVGDVVNQLPVGINVEGVSETWQDQSGKYWIGNQDPKLCFCRILRSQTVMVRVGGGWSELSKFIKDHFADSFRLLPESPPRPGLPEERWISSATLLEASVEIESPPVPPRTPEPAIPFVPSFALSTPSGQSMKSPSNSPSAKGSPLTPLQFMRRADMDTLLRPVTPTKPSAALRPRNAAAQITTPARNSVWRP